MTDKAIPILPSHDLELTAAMLGRIGFRETARYDGYSVLERGSIELHYYAEAQHDPFERAGQAYVRVDDVDALYAQVVAAGFDVWNHVDGAAELRTRWDTGASIARISDLDDKPWGLREFALLDEDNNLIRIGQPSTDRR